MDSFSPCTVANKKTFWKTIKPLPWNVARFGAE